MTHIYKIANGSLSTTIGDTRLFYTGNYSVRARAISGIFLDNPPVLSPDYATLVWRYYNDTDRFMLIHVQGSQVVDASQGRNYPYRAAYEVSRDDINALAVNGHMPMTSLLQQIPHIQAFASTERMAEEHEVARTLSAVTTEAKNLADRIIAAFANAQPIFIYINTDGRRMHENGVFQAPELATLLTAIELLPMSLARYATFAFCADEHTAAVMDNILVNVIVEGAKLQIPNGCKLISWAEATQPQPINANILDTILTVASALPGSTAPMTPVTEASIKFNRDVKRFDIITAKRPGDVATDEWDTWLIRHNINEISIASWDEFIAMSKHMPSNYLSKLAQLYHANALQWPSDDRMYSYNEVFGFSDTELATRLSIDLLIKLNRRIIDSEGEQIDQENIVALYKPSIIANDIAKYKNLAQGPLDATERLLKQCVSIKRYRNRRQYAFDVLYKGVVDYLCDKYADIDDIDTWKDISKDFWKKTVQQDNNKKETLVHPLTFETLKVVFMSRINAMTDQQLSTLTTEVVNVHGTTKSKKTLSIIGLLYKSLI